jgi:hypothetical protein
MLAAVSVASHARDYHLPPGITTGNDYQDYSVTDRQRYLAGVLDGIYLAPQLAQQQHLARVEKLSRCESVMRLTGVQLVAIVDHYMADHPEQWGGSMNTIAYKALADACRKNAAPIN